MHLTQLVLEYSSRMNHSSPTLILQGKPLLVSKGQVEPLVENTLVTVPPSKSNTCRRRSSIIDTGVSLWKSYGGILMALLSSICFSITFLLIKCLEQQGEVKAFGGALLLNIGVFLPCICGIFYNEFGHGWRNRDRVFQGLWPVDSKEKRFTLGILCVQATLQAAAVIFRTYALRYISIGDMSVIVFSSPVVTTVIAHFVLKEKCGLVFIFIAIFTLAGVVLVTKPPIITGNQSFDTETLIGSSLGVGAMLSLSFKFVITRKIKEEHFLTMTLFLGSFGILLSLPLFLIFEDWTSIIPNNLNGSLLRLGLFCAFCAVAFINLALKMESTGMVALIRSCDVIFAFLLQYLFLGVIPDVFSIVGALVVWTGVITAAGHKFFTDRKSRGHRREMNQVRRRSIPNDF